MELGARARRILYAVITEFIATGEPVGSRTLSRKYELDLSAASIRNVLADLEEAGYLQQPHTSAGRVPTERAFRLFVDALVQMRELTAADRQAIEQRFEMLEPGSNVLRETARMLAGLTGNAAVIVAPRMEAQPLRQVRFLHTRPGEMLAVVITMAGIVENRFIAVELPPSKDELTRIHNLLDEVIEGRTLAEVRELFAQRLEDAQTELDALRKRAFELGDLALFAATPPVDVVIEGHAQLLERPEFSDVERMRNMMRVFEERVRLLNILDSTLGTSGVRIVLPGEQEHGIEHVSVVASRYGERAVDGVGSGSVAIIGPTRMDYASIVPLVHETARGLGAYLERRDGKNG